MRIYCVEGRYKFGYEPASMYWCRNKRQANRTRSRLKKEFGYDSIKIVPYEIERNKKGILELLNNVTH